MSSNIINKIMIYLKEHSTPLKL